MELQLKHTKKTFLLLMLWVSLPLHSKATLKIFPSEVGGQQLGEVVRIAIWTDLDVCGVKGELLTTDDLRARLGLSLEAVSTLKSEQLGDTVMRAPVADRVALFDFKSGAITSARELVRRLKKVSVPLVFRGLPCKGERRTIGTESISSASITVDLTHNAGKVDTEHTKQRSFLLKRASPWQAASCTQRRLPLLSTGGQKLTDVTVRAQNPPHGLETRPVGVGTVTVVDNPSREIPRAGSDELTLKLSSFKRAGTYEIDLVVDSPELEQPALIPIQVTVQDKAPWPFAVILLGVGVAFLVNRYTTKSRARRTIEEAVTTIKAATKSSLDELVQPVEEKNKNFFVRRKANLEHEDLRGLSVAAAKFGRAGGTDDGESDPAKEEASTLAAQGARQLREGQVALYRSRLQFGEVGLALLGVLIATATGFESLYFDAPFGTAQDYLGAFLWGFTASAGVNILSGIVERLGQLWNPAAT